VQRQWNALAAKTKAGCGIAAEDDGKMSVAFTRNIGAVGKQGPSMAIQQCHARCPMAGGTDVRKKPWNASLCSGTHHANLTAIGHAVAVWAPPNESPKACGAPPKVRWALVFDGEAIKGASADLALASDHVPIAWHAGSTFWGQAD